MHDEHHHLVLAGLRSAGTAITAHSATAGMVEHRLLDLVGADVLAAPADRVLEPVDEVVPAVGVAAQPVAGVEPEVAHASTVFSGMPK